MIGVLFVEVGRGRKGTGGTLGGRKNRNNQCSANRQMSVFSITGINVPLVSLHIPIDKEMEEHE